MATRKIIHIDEEKCTGCGDCIIACAEAALEIVDGKAKLVKDMYCDGLGACLNCPEGALTIIERDAADFDEEAAMERVRRLKAQEEAAKAKKHSIPCGCPGSSAMALDNNASHSKAAPGDEVPSSLGHWPIKLQLLGPGAPFLEGADLLLLADCAGTSYPNIHQNLLAGKAVAMGCPKLDDVEAHIERLSDIIKGSDLKTLKVVHMEVPCCRGFVYAAQEAIKRSGVALPLSTMIIGRNGKILAEETL